MHVVLAARSVIAERVSSARTLSCRLLFSQHTPCAHRWTRSTDERVPHEAGAKNLEGQEADEAADEAASAALAVRAGSAEAGCAASALVGAADAAGADHVGRRRLHDGGCGHMIAARAHSRCAVGTEFRR